MLLVREVSASSRGKTAVQALHEGVGGRSTGNDVERVPCLETLLRPNVDDKLFVIRVDRRHVFAPCELKIGCGIKMIASGPALDGGGDADREFVRQTE